MYSPYSVHGNPALASGSNTTSNQGHGESSSHSASPIQHPSTTTTHLTPHSTYNHHSHSSSDFGGLASSGPSYNLSSPTHGFDYTLPTFTDSPWSFASGSTIPPPNHTHHGSSTSAYDSQPNSAGLPVPAPLPFESQLRDQALALHQHWGSFAPVTNTNSNPLFANPLQHQMHALQLQQQQHHHHHHHHHQHHQPQLHPSTSTSIPLATNWNLATETPSSFFEALTQMFPNHMDEGSTPLSENGRMTFSDYFPPAGLMDYTEPVNMSLQDNTGVPTPPLASGAAGNGKGKEKADGMGDYFDGLYGVNGMNDIKRSKAEEFDKDVALLQTYLTDLVGLLEPFASSPTQPSPPKPPPFLHTRFLRLSTSIHQTLLQLGPSAHPFLATPISGSKPLSKSSTSTPAPRRKPEKTPSSKARPISLDAEKEMELIRKRRDWLISKAAQTKQASERANGPTQGGMSSSPRTNVNGHTAVTPGMMSASQSPSGSTPLHTPGIHGAQRLDGNLGLGSLGNLNNLSHLGNLGNLGSLGNLGLGGYASSPVSISRPMTPGSLARMNDGRGPGAGKTKDNPSGRCHGCGDQFTMEWRRGPDGAKTLCDACGMHYAKLSSRRRESESPVKMSPAPAPIVAPPLAS